MLKADGFDSCIVGIVRSAGQEDKIIYDYDKCVDLLITRDGMKFDDAHEFMEVNVLGAYMGSGSPAFLRKMQMDEIEELYAGELTEAAPVKKDPEWYDGGKK